MNRISTALTCVVVMAAAPAQAQAVKSVVTASNGVEVTVYSDEFANRYEYSAPSVESGEGHLMVATIKKGGVAPAPHLTGFFVYAGEWRKYVSALFRGGDAAQFVERGRNVGSCASSRYSRGSCTLTETFMIEVTPAELARHGQGGKIAIQVRAQDTSATVFEIPTAHFDAVKEVASR